MSKKTSGLRISAVSSLKSGKKELLYCGVTAVLLTVGWAAALIPAFPSCGVQWWAAALASVVLSLGILLLFSVEKAKKFILPVAVLAAAVFCGLFWGGIKSGFLQLINDFLDFLTTKTGRIYLDYAVSAPGGTVYAVTVLFFVLSLFSARAAYFGEILPAALPLLAAGAGYAAGFLTSAAGAVCTSVGLVLLLVRKAQASSGRAYSLKGILIQFCAIALCAGMAVASGAYLVKVPETGLLDRAKKLYHELRYDSETASMPEGDLRDLGPWDKNSTAALEVTMEENQKLYLRGFTGEVYTGTAWEGLDTKKLAEYEDLFYWLHKNGFYGQSMLSSAYGAAGEPEVLDMTIKNLSACRKYGYFPYAVSGNGLLDPELIGDSFAPGSSGTEKIGYIPGSVPQWYETQRLLATAQGGGATAEYLALEEDYREFVYENYLQINNASVGVLKTALDIKQENTLAEIMELIRAYLGENITYDENTWTLNGGNDFFRYFMEQSKSGYSVHYATAAVIMLRYCGVPARYVEGYYLSEDDAEEYRNGETISLTENNAHAWAEYYLDGVGWVPFEVTPGYIDDEEIIGSAGDEDDGRLYAQSDKEYTQPIQREEPQEVDTLKNSFKIEPEYFLLSLPLAITILLTIVLFRRRRIKKALTDIRSQSNREAIEGLYGYAVALMRYGGIDGFDEHAAALNIEARFSGCEMTDGERGQMEAFVDAVVEKCRKGLKVWKRFYMRFIKCLY